MSDGQTDLELDATGVELQLANLATKASDMVCRWVARLDPKTMVSKMTIDDETVVALLKQAAAIQHLLNKLKERRH